MTAKRQKQQRGPGVSRRQFLGRGGAAVGGVALGSTLLGSGASAFASVLGQGGGGEVGGKLSVLNWPLYLDKKSPGLFEDETGIDLKYSESLSDNNEFFAKYQRQMSQDQYPGFDIAVPSSWMAERLIGLGYVQKLPLDDIPNAANLLPEFQNPPWDPTGEYTLPWQTGMSGISYNIEITGRELTSVDDLFDKKFKNKIGILKDLRATMTLLLLSEGVDPGTVTYKQAEPAFNKLEKAVDSGQVRRFTTNDYQDDLVDGNFAACVGWSGDVAQLTLDNEDLRFVIPDEGGERWADTMTWIASAKRRAQVAAWMNYFYDPANAARVEAFIQFIPPVAGADAELVKIDPDLGTSPNIFPPPDVQERLHFFNPELSPKDQEKFDARFAEIQGS
jgi:spermidine/putrescine transport system substrate-binding protein